MGDGACSTGTGTGTPADIASALRIVKTGPASYVGMDWKQNDLVTPVVGLATHARTYARTHARVTLPYSIQNDLVTPVGLATDIHTRTRYATLLNAALP